jgi:hypothetical protein
VDSEVHEAATELEEAETGRRMAGVGRPPGGAWRLMGNRWWKQEPVVEAVGGWVEELRSAVPELRDGSGRSEKGWSGLSTAAQR